MGANRFRAWARIGAVLSAALAAIACGGDHAVSLAPEAGWRPVPTDAVAVNTEGETLSWDFGTVRTGDRVVGRLEVTNRGSAPMTVRRPDLAAPFSSDVPAAGLPVGVGETRPIELVFAPTADDAYAWSGTLGILEDVEQTIAVRLAGVGQTPRFSCDTDELDFGRVVKGRGSQLTVTCRNDTDVDGVLVIGEITGNEAAQFSHAYTGNRGHAPVEAGKALTIEVAFEASLVGDASAVLPIESEGRDGPERVARIRLLGTTLDHVISCKPTVIDFGFVAPGTAGRREVTCKNEGTDPFHLTALELDPTSDPRFTWDPAAFPAEVPAAVGDVDGEARFELVFAPLVEDESARRNGLLHLSTDDPGSPRIEFVLTGFAGGPVIGCAPAAIDFGVVAKGLPATRTFLCTNAGTDDPARADDTLVVSAIESSNPAEFRAEVRGGLDPAGYLVGATFTVDVTYGPVDDGIDAAELRLFTNAVNVPAGAPFAVRLSGHGRDLPACDFEQVPPELRFGIVEKGRTATLEFAVRNHLPDAECLVQNLRLAPTCDSEFGLPAGPVDLAVVPPAGEVRFPVTFSPREYRESGFSCDVLFDISDPANPHRSEHATGASQAPCALIAPNDLDFGTVEPKCATRDREFEVLNLCGTPLVLDAVELAETASDEFFIRSTLPAGTTIAPGASAPFTMAYRPEDLGLDLGAVYVWVDGTDEPYSAMLRGQGAMGAMQTDSFAQNERPKVDVLWVIDNSGSMSDDQTALANNLQPFLSFAQAQEIDYQIGITTTGITPGSSGCPGGANGGEDGRLFPVDNSRPRILTPSTPNLEEVWRQNIKVGTCHGTEWPMEAALRALTAPLVDHCDDPRHGEPNDGNCGFLRKEAHLSIIDVSDESDWSPNPVNFYYNAFQSLKGFRNPNLFNFHAITIDKTGGACTGPDGTGDRAIALVEKTQGGVYQPICAPNWAESLRLMSAAAFGFQTCFHLGNEPADKNGNGTIGDAESEIEVRMNGVVTPSRGDQGQVVWRYVKDQNTVCFEPLAVPEPGTQLEVRYQVACLSW